MAQSKTQDPKYDIVDGRIVNAVTRVAIPEDEPILIMRAKDVHAYPTLDFYVDRCADPVHREAIEKRMEEFSAFRDSHSELMREPDSVPAVDLDDEEGVFADFLAYIHKTNGPSISQFDEASFPNGPAIRRDMEDEGLIKYVDGHVHLNVPPEAG